MSIRILLFDNDGKRPILEQLDKYFDHQLPQLVIMNKGDWIKTEGELQPKLAARYESKTNVSPKAISHIINRPEEPLDGFIAVMYRSVSIICVSEDDQSYVGLYLNS